MIYTAKTFTFRQCSKADLAQIMFIQQETLDNLENPDLLRRNTEEMLSSCLEEPHFTLGVYSNENLIAFGILYDGMTTSENIGFDMDIDTEKLNEVINFKLVIVRPEYRGNGLQKQIINVLCEKAKDRNKKIICATVSPENTHSIRNFEQCGFEFHSTKTKYGGLTRNIYFKYL